MSKATKEIQGWFWHHQAGPIPCVFDHIITPQENVKATGMYLVNYRVKRKIIPMIIYPKSFITME